MADARKKGLLGGMVDPERYPSLLKQLQTGLVIPLLLAITCILVAIRGPQVFTFELGWMVPLLLVMLFVVLPINVLRDSKALREYREWKKERENRKR